MKKPLRINYAMHMQWTMQKWRVVRIAIERNVIDKETIVEEIGVYNQIVDSLVARYPEEFSVAD